MYDEWKMPPLVPLPCYPLRLGGEVKVHDALCEEIRQDYERRCEETRRQWPRQRVELVKKRIRDLRRCQRSLAAERPRYVEGCVYLMWCPSLMAYKIGHTDDVNRRIGELRQVLDPRIERRMTYHPLVSRPLLEEALHCHFRHFHFASNESEELFKLPQEEVDGFEATTALIERHLLAVEILHLKAVLSKLEADLREAE